MFYAVYETRCLVNDKIYVGVHKTNDLEDGYLGSGKILKRAIEKYGRENFKKRYLAIFDNPEDMFEMESRLVSEEFVERDDTYNLKQGGEGGWDHIDRSETSRRTITEVNKRPWSQERKKNHKRHLEKIHLLGNKAAREKYPEGTFKDKTHSETAKKRIGEANSQHQKGSGNSQYGTMWITNGSHVRKMKKEDKIPHGWRRGRK